ncbi:MAG: bifunctional 3-deoxy-7-phosphoheptulonate synthase/chorismate mutase type II [Bacteroidales bacterium]
MKSLLDTKPVQEWGNVFNTHPVVIAGPCSAESEKQVLETAHQLKDKGITIFRAGIWKPRTRPGHFEGVGAAGLPWLKKVKEETGMLVAIEVASEKHVYEALKHGVDILWVGARSTANPFVVQDIADALNGIDIPVLVKNPVNPDLELWKGAIERIHKAGITKIGAIHRGFSSYGKTAYRNLPTWQLPIDLKTDYPNIPMFNDPSHIGGKREFLFEIMQKAMDLNFDGIIIESHCDPSVALSDAAQQVTPDNLEKLLKSLIIRTPDSPTQETVQELKEYRAQIDSFDRILLNILEERMEVVKKIGRFKKNNNITILQSTRWEQIIEKNLVEGSGRGFSEKFISSLFKAIHEESIEFQTKVMNG